MKKLILFIILVLFIPIYLFAQECDYIFTDDEIKNNELDNLLSGGIYKNKKAAGIYCAKLEDIVELQFKMKNGKINSEIRAIIYYEKDKPFLDVYTSDYSIFMSFYEMLEDNGLPDYEFLKNKKVDYDFKMYHENGNIQTDCSVKNGAGECTIYDENGAMHSYMPINNFQNNGIAEIYDENGKLWSTITYKDDKIISAECADTVFARLRPGGLKWTKAEISNWEKGLEVKCGY